MIILLDACCISWSQPLQQLSSTQLQTLRRISPRNNGYLQGNFLGSKIMFYRMYDSRELGVLPCRSRAQSRPRLVERVQQHGVYRSWHPKAQQCWSQMTRWTPCSQGCLCPSRCRRCDCHLYRCRRFARSLQKESERGQRLFASPRNRDRHNERHDLSAKVLVAAGSRGPRGRHVRESLAILFIQARREYPTTL